MSKRGMCSALLVVFLGMVGLGWSQDVDPNLVAWWKLDEGAGNTATDSAGYYEGTLQGGPIWVYGVVDGALQFDGGDDCIAIGDYPVFNDPEGSFSVALWANVYGWTGQWQNSMIGIDDNSGWCLRRFGDWWSQNYPERYTMPDTVLSFTTRGIGHVADGVEDSPSNTPPPIGEWTHITCVYDSEGNQKVIYFNGVEDAVWPTNAGSLTPATQALYIGARSNGADTGPEGNFNGRLDDVRFYDRALDANEVAVLAIAPITFKAKDPSPLDGADMISAPLLQWTLADVADTQRLYLGTTPDLGSEDLITEDLTDSSFQVTDVLEPFTTYYWRVDAVEADGVTVHTGDVWQFDSGPAEAFNPNPADGYLWAATDANLNWTAGVSAATHEVYFGTNEADVLAGNNDTFKGNQGETAFDPGTLASETIYYWRVDEVEADGQTKHTGSIWRLKTRPEFAVTDPSLVGWWPLDEGQGPVALDWSGNGNHGILRGDPEWVIGHEGGCLALDGIGDYVDCGNAEILNLQTSLTMAVWIKVAAFTRDWEAIIAKGDGAYRLSRSATNGDATHMGINGTSANFFDGTIVVTDDEWHHIAGTFGNRRAVLYVDGVVDVSNGVFGQVNSSSGVNFYIGENGGAGSRYLGGLVDDVRLYNRALSQEEIQQVMRGDTTKAWNPYPATGLTTDVEKAVPLTWSAGDNAVAHEVYLGTDAFTVDQATPESESLFQGRQTETSFTPTNLEWDTTYYWRVDEITGDGTVNKGWIWAFTVAEYIIVDDIEDYHNTNVPGDNRIFETWRDGLPINSLNIPGNGTGMIVGVDDPPYGPELTIVHSGAQSLPLTYDNSADPYYSETDRTFAQSQDWSARRGRTLSTLSLWYRGRWASPSSFDPNGDAYTIVGSGTDIWNTADQFQFAYLPLNGDGSITARIDHIDNVNTWAKAGVMIRNGLGADAVNAAVLVAPSGRVTFQIREFEGGETASEETGAGSITLPHWVRLTREGGVFTAEHSEDGVNWELVGINNPLLLGMFGDVYVGLAVTSHVNAGSPCRAEFTHVQVTGAPPNVFSTSMDIGLPVNDPAELTVSIEDASGTTATLTHSDGTDAVLQNEWLQWQILLSDFANQGVDLTRIQKMAIGIGNQQPDGKGKLYIDDIRLYPE